MTSNPVILIPARMGASRFPNKVMAEIAGAPMIVQVWRRAHAASIGRVVVAAAEQVIVEAIAAEGGEAVLTDPGHPSGSDRIYEALCKIDAQGHHDAVLNVQGDLPTIEPEAIRAAMTPLDEPAVDIATIGAEIKLSKERSDPNVVKAVAAIEPPARIGRALYFTRGTAPFGEGPLYHHIGLYAYRRKALEEFVSLSPGVLERREKLEQLRALEAGMRIDLALVDTVPLGVDTPADLEQAATLLASRETELSK
ncbi:MAG: 3-deoxy-manno-octulosonate cytidylyltransferase [Pseudomonadota bacterium]|nr:3-deoxy-manno-octulosonate cytidylyltransferase [Pseudomonadota bacterium]